MGTVVGLPRFWLGTDSCRKVSALKATFELSQSLPLG